MPKSLFIVESPAKARTLSRYLGKDFIVRATVGHIKDLPANSLGVRVDEEFAPYYRVIKGKSKVVKDIRDAAVGKEAVYLASDPDREGEAIAWHVAEEIAKTLSKDKRPRFYRVLLNEITKSGVRKALSTAGELDRSRYESQLARRILDRLVGYELSPLLWRKVSAGLSAGRVQSVAVALVVDREREISSFEAEEYWVVKVRLEGGQPPPFDARLVAIEGKKAHVPDEKTAKPLLENLEGAAYRVAGIKREEKAKYPLPPFITSTLQQEAFRLLRYSAKKTMSLAQRLYEGVDLGDLGTHGLITYIRTDSTRIADEAVASVRSHVEKAFGKRYLPGRPMRYRNKRTAQDAHEAIRPTSMEFAPEQLTPHLSRDLARLYGLIWNRFLACQMAPARYDVTVITVAAEDKWTFEATGKILLFDGYLKLYRDSEAQENAANGLPKLEEGESLKLLEVTGDQQFTQPPPRFTEGTLVKELEKKGIGRPSTYATILSTIQDKKYIERLKGKFSPTDLGCVVTDLLRDNFPDVIDAGFTALMESKLDKIEEGELKRREILSEFWGDFKTALTNARTSMKSVKRDPEKTDISCPRCQTAMVVRFGRNGSFLACSAFPKCKTTLAFTRDEQGKPQAVEEPVGEEKCPVCQGQMVLKDGRFGRFWACHDYPDCKGTLAFSTGLGCPRENCEGTLLEKRSKKGSTYYRCSLAPECDYVLFSRIALQACPGCDNSYMEEKGRGKKKTLKCPRCGQTA